MSDLLEWRIQPSMFGAELNVSLELLVQKPVVDRNHVATLQVRRDLVDAPKHSFIEDCFINRPLDEDKYVAVEAHQFLRSFTDQAHRHRVQEFVGKMHACKWLQRFPPLNSVAKGFERLTLSLL